MSYSYDYLKAKRKVWSKLSKADKYDIGRKGIFGKHRSPCGFPK